MSPRNGALLATGVVAVSFSAIFIRLAHAPALSVALYRNAFAAAMVVPLALLYRRDELRRIRPGQALIAVGAGALLAVHFATWIASLSYTTIAASVVLVTASPILVAAVSWAAFDERVTRTALVGILIGLAGAAIVSGGDLLAVSARAAAGDALALAGAAAAAGYFVAGRKLRQDVSLLSYVALVYSTCAILLWPAAVVAGVRLTGFPAKTWGLFVLMAVVPQMLGHTVFNYLLKDVSATVVAIAIMGEPVGSTLLALVIFGESPPWPALLGGILLLAGVYVALTAEGRTRRASRQAITPLE